MPTTPADAKLIVDTWVKYTMSSAALDTKDKALGNWLKDGQAARTAAEANTKAIADLTAKVDQILAAVAAGIVVNAQVALTEESAQHVAELTADEIHADPERDGT
jgi:hypothetical protein